MAQSVLAKCPTGVFPVDADTIERVKHQLCDHQFVSAIQIFPKIEQASKSA